MEAQLDGGLTEAEATLLALGIHADTGSLCYDSTTARDATAGYAARSESSSHRRARSALPQSRSVSCWKGLVVVVMPRRHLLLFD
jgi:nanoRNase/pAp phosphatase (c-di-AMP/oligoRNAs hydrolase)